MATTKTTERPQINAQARTQTGSRVVRRLRRDGLVPGVLYGKAVEATAILLNRRDLVKLLHARTGEHGLLTLRVESDGKKPLEKPVLLKQVAHDPVNGDVVHVDFQAIALTEQIRIKVPVHLTGAPVGVKQDGGVLEHFLREIEVECLPTAIPDKVDFDITQMKIGDTIHVRDLAAPAGAKITTDAESPVASVLAPREEKPEEAAEAVTEPEVIREKKPEAEGDAAAEGKAEKPDKAEKAEKKEEKK